MFIEWSTQPKSFGWQHILGIVLMILALIGGAILGAKNSGEANEKKNTKILGFAAIYFIAMDVFIEVFSTIAEGKYLLTFIPFQLCSMVMFMLPFIPFIKKGVVKDAFLGLIAFVSLTGAVFYFVKPTAAIYTPYIIKTVHSMLWHISMVALGTYTMTAFNLLDKNKRKGAIASLIAYAGMVLLAVALNFILHAIDPSQPSNLFYISYYNVNYGDKFFSYPILGAIMPSQRPYFLYVIVFIIYFSLGASATYFVGFGIKKLIEYIKVKRS